MAEKLKKHFELLIREDSVKVYVIEEETTEKLCDSLAGIIDGFDSIKFLESVPVQSTDLVLLAKGSEKLKTVRI